MAYNSAIRSGAVNLETRFARSDSIKLFHCYSVLPVTLSNLTSVNFDAVGRIVSTSLVLGGNQQPTLSAIARVLAGPVHRRIVPAQEVIVDEDITA